MTLRDDPKSRFGDCHMHGISGRGPSTAEVMIVGVAPAREEMRTGKVYSGETGKLLEAVMQAYEVMPDDCYFTNLLCWWEKEPTLEHVQQCLPRLVREIDTIKPKVIVALGALPIQFFTGAKKSATMRGSCFWSEDFNCWIVNTWQPTVVFQVSPGLIADVVRDISKINYIKDKPKDFGRVAYEVVHSPVQAQFILDSDWLREAEFAALDVECKWDPVAERWTSDIRCLAISDGDTTYTFTEESLEGLVWPTQGVRWTFWNGRFDTEKLLIDQGVDLPIVEDVMLMGYSLDERGGSDDEAQGVDIAVGIHGLKRNSREWCGADHYEVDLKKAPDPVVWEYNAKDAAYTARLGKLFLGRQIEEDVRDFYVHWLVPEAMMCRDEKMHGIYVPRAKVEGLATTWGEEWLQLDTELEQEAFAVGWPEKQFNANSHAQVKRLLNNYFNIPVKDTRHDTLAEYAGHPWVAKRLRIAKLTKNLGTYVRGVLNALEVDGRVHPEPSIHATVSGRKTYHNPPVGTIPTGGQYMDPDEEPDEDTKAEIAEFGQVRALFAAPPGKVFIEADFSNAELWSAAGLSGDPIMLADLKSGDFHSNACEGMFKVKREDYAPETWKAMRRESKYVTFGVLFWRGAFSLYMPAPGQGGNLGKKYTLKEIEDMVDAWHQKYIVHYRWGLQQIKEAQENAEQRAPSGRKRRYHAPGVYGKHFANMAVNWPVQTVAHDHLVIARLEFDRLIRRGEFPARTLWDGHDAIYFECDDDPDTVNSVCKTIKEVMERPRWFDFGIPVDIKVGTSWADGHGWPEEKGVPWYEHLKGRVPA